MTPDEALDVLGQEYEGLPPDVDGVVALGVLRELVESAHAVVDLVETGVDDAVKDRFVRALDGSP